MARDWQRLITGCFVGPDFATYPADEKRAFELLSAAREDGLGWKAMRRQLTRFLGDRMAPEGDGRSQIARARILFKPWLMY